MQNKLEPSLFSAGNFPRNQRILYSVLNWGLGHASRSIHLIQELLRLNNEVVIASDGSALELLRRRFPEINTYALAPLQLSYSLQKRHFPFQMLKQIPKLIRHKAMDESLIHKIVLDFKPDLLISDHRYGCFHRDCKSYFLSHQLHLKTNFAEKLAQSIHESYLKNFNELLIPDYEHPQSLAGELSKRLAIDKPQTYIGALSRFAHFPFAKEKAEFAAIAILSGPEPSRSLFEQSLLNEFKTRPNERFVLVRGLYDSGELKDKPINTECFAHIGDETLLEKIAQSQRVISRSGYSSIMDYFYLGIQAELHPTPGQGEQEYLAKRWSGKLLPTPTFLRGSPDTISE